MPIPFTRRQAALGLAALAAWPLASRAQAYPSKPLRFIVPYPPGGGNDDVARMLARRMAESMGQPVLVENRAGASGMIAGDFVAKSAPDGYTVMIDHSGIVINPALYPRVSYQVATDLAPVSLAVQQGNMLLAHPELPARTLPDLIAYAKANPGKLNYASPGNGTPQHIGMVLLSRMAGIDIRHIPYKGGAPATQALVAGEVQLLLSGTTGLPFVRSGRARVLATTGMQRSAALPDVPTVQEAGVRDYTNLVWLGIFAPAHTPAPVLERLNQEVLKALAAADVRSALAEKNYEVVGSSAADFGRVIARDLDIYGKVVKEAGIQPD